MAFLNDRTAPINNPTDQNCSNQCPAQKNVTVQLLNDYAADIDILLIQEPAWSFIGRNPSTGNIINGPVALQGWNTILPVTSLNEDSPRPRTLTYYRPCPDFSITLGSDIMEDRDIQVLDIAQENQPTTTIINVYNDSPKGDQCVLNQIRSPNFLPRHPTLITGDFNLHHPSWAREDRALKNDQLANSIAEWLSQENYTMLNKRGKITHLARHAGERPSVIDLSFANAEATQQDTFKEWAIDPNLSLDSDHNSITLDHGLKEVNNFLPLKYNIKKTDPAKWSKIFAQELDMVKGPLTALFDNREPDNAQLDTYTELISAAMQNALAKAAPERKPSTAAKPWWDKDLADATTRVINARMAHHDFQNLTGEFSPALQTDVYRNRNYFKHLCKFKKKAWVSQILKTASSNDIWTFTKWSHGARNYPTPPISRGPNLPKATSHNGKCEALRKELYQPPPQPLTKSFPLTLRHT